MDWTKSHSVAPLFAGISGGVVSTTLLLPLDVIKVRLQVSEQPQHNDNGSKRTKRLGAFRAFRSIIRHEGIAGIYQGLIPAVIGSAVSWGGYFYLYEGFKKKLTASKRARGKPEELTSADNFGVAVVSGAIMVFLTNPVWLIKTRIQLQMKKSADSFGLKKPYNGLVDAARTIVKEEGFWALYKGTVPALALTSHGGVQFVAYEFLKKHFHYARPKRDDSKSVLERLELSMGFLTMGALSKM
jgi:solute carrier family 25 (mitochondrial folate transporter), member 32